MILKNLLPKTTRDAIAWRFSQRELHRIMTSQDLKTIIRGSFDYKGVGVYKYIYALQREREITQLAAHVQESDPRVIVEIGTAKGGTLFIWSRSNLRLDLIVSIDLPGGEFGGGYDVRREKLYKSFLADRPNTKMILMREDSHAEETCKQLTAHLGGRKIDFLWIDGDHAYEGVKKDFLMYSPLVRPGGIVAFHDIVTRGFGHEVTKLWDEVKANYPSTEIIEDKSGDMGIGILRL